MMMRMMRMMMMMMKTLANVEIRQVVKPLPMHYLHQEILRSVAFVCWLVRSLVCSLVRPGTRLAEVAPYKLFSTVSQCNE